MPGGTLPEYIKNNPRVDRLRLVGYFLLMYSPHPYLRQQLSGVASGLDYLHFRDVIHGYLRGVRDYPRSCFTIVLILGGQSNVVIGADGQARIADFRFAKVITNVGPEETASDQHVETGYWSAPEILKDEPTSKATDIFSFAMVMIEARHG